MNQRAAGLLLEREVSTLLDLIEDPARPLVAILGGAKVSDKIRVIERFLHVADTILIGGAMAFPFLAAQGHAVGSSLCADEDVEHARTLLRTADGVEAQLILPIRPGPGRPFRCRRERRSRWTASTSRMV